MTDTYSQSCSMTPSDANNISKMVASLFSEIKVDINLDRETYSPSQAAEVPTGEVLVTFRVPREGVNMINFFKEFSRTLNEKPTTARKEKKQ